MNSWYTKINLEKSKEFTSRGAERILVSTTDLVERRSQFFKFIEYITNVINNNI
ncbi:MAG: palindromic element RPE5 domain-containing protein [Rickettsia endosymbiont of Glossina mortisans submortisans]|nr:palindromic element RPE5 domain-containing protein [Rickettsia endosymbiont of Glossina mortisans submortisans]